MKEKLYLLKETTLARIAELNDAKNLTEIRTRVLGRKGDLTTFLRGLKDLPPEERSQMGQLANQIKAELEREFDNKEGRDSGGRGAPETSFRICRCHASGQANDPWSLAYFESGDR